MGAHEAGDVLRPNRQVSCERKKRHLAKRRSGVDELRSLLHSYGNTGRVGNSAARTCNRNGVGAGWGARFRSGCRRSTASPTATCRHAAHQDQGSNEQHQHCAKVPSASGDSQEDTREYAANEPTPQAVQGRNLTRSGRRYGQG
jgi:hypothetical protein